MRLLFGRMTSEELDRAGALVALAMIGAAALIGAILLLAELGG